MTASMFRDLAAGLPVEADHVIGDLVARADAAKVPAPRLRIAYTQLKSTRRSGASNCRCPCRPAKAGTSPLVRHDPEMHSAVVPALSRNPYSAAVMRRVTGSDVPDSFRGMGPGSPPADALRRRLSGTTVVIRVIVPTTNARGNARAP